MTRSPEHTIPPASWGGLSRLARPSYEGTSLTLLAKARAQDFRAWQRLVVLYSPLVRKWCVRAGVRDQDAEDVTQEVFETVALRLAQFERGDRIGSFRGWLRAITRNKIGDLYRRLRSQPTAVGGADDVFARLAGWDAEDKSDVREERRELARRALNLIRGEFPELHWRAFWAVVVEDRPPAEVAAELGLSRNAVYLAKSRILQRLRAEFADVLGVPSPLVCA